MLKIKYTTLVFAALSIFSCATLLTNCASTPYQESTGQYVDSTVITTKVKTKLLEDNRVKALPITVKTYKNIVQLSGFVDTPYQKTRAREIAQNVPGVDEVQNLLVVKKK